MDGSEELLLAIADNASEIAFDGSVLYLRDVGHGLGPDRPVHHVTWYGAAAYCDWLNLKVGHDRSYDHSTWECNDHDPYREGGYRLPTEAEWEWACRAGSSDALANGPLTERFCGPDAVLDEIGWYCGNNKLWPAAVGQKEPNAWGLYDMHGNVGEWCNDWYRDDYYTACGESITDPAGPRSGYARRVERGGCYLYGAEMCRSGDRNSYHPLVSGKTTGFRPVRLAR